MTLQFTQFFFFALPFFFALSIFSGFDINIARLFPLFILLILLSEAVHLKRKIILPRGVLGILFLGFFLWSFFSLFYSSVPLWTARKLLFFVTFMPLLIILPTVWSWHQRDGVEKIIKATVGGAVLISCVGIVQFLLQFPLSLDQVASLWASITPFFLGSTFSTSVALYNSWYVHVADVDLFRAIAFFPDPHVFAFYTGMTLPLAYGLWRTTRRPFWLTGTIIIFTANIFTFSRGGEVALLGGLILAVILIWNQLSTKLRHALFLSALLITSVLFFPANPLTDRFLSSFDASDTSNSSRVTLWSQAISAISENPIRGVGLGAYPAHVDPRATYRTPIYVHNTYLDVSVELGLVGGGLFFGLLLYVFTQFYRSRSNPISRYAMISLSIFMIHGLFDTPLFSVHIFPLLLLLLTLSDYFTNHDRPS